MKSALKLSVSANIVLLVLAFCLVRSLWMPEDSSLSQSPKSSIAAGLTPAHLPYLETGRFQWSHIESQDYRTYIANLRSIGCPGQTIRDIIVADVHGLDAPRYLELELKQPSIKSPRPGILLARQSPETDLERLHNEEDAVISTLLRPQSTSPGADNAGSPQSLLTRATDRIVSVPLVFQNVNP